MRILLSGKQYFGLVDVRKIMLFRFRFIFVILSFRRKSMQKNLIENISVFLFFVILINSCGSGNKDTEYVIPYSQLKNIKRNELMEWNRNLTQTDKVIIESFIERRRWDMEMTGTGLFFQIYHSATGPKVEEGKFVEFEYITSLLDGTVLYNSDIYGTRIIRIGRNQDERGLDEGLRLLRVGDKARFILHPFLAFGVPGDGYKVPFQAILLYDIEVIDVRDTEERMNLL